MTDHFKIICAEAINIAGTNPFKLLVYAELEDGVRSVDLMWQEAEHGVVQFCFAPSSLCSLVQRFWEQGSESIGPKAWATMEYIVQDGRFNIGLVYPEQLDPDEDLSDRRPRVIEAIFPGAAVDYSRARA